MHAKNYSSKNIDLVIYYLFVYSIISINDCLSPVVSISCMYKITISVPSLFTLYKIQVSVFYCFNTALRFIVFMYYFKQQCTACKRPQINRVMTIYHRTYDLLQVIMTLLMSSSCRYFLLRLHIKILPCHIQFGSPTC